MLTIEQAENLKSSIDQRGVNADTLLALIELLTDTIESEPEEPKTVAGML